MKVYGWRIGANEITEIGKTPVAAKVVDKKRAREDAKRELVRLMDEISETLAANAKKRGGR